MKNSVSRPVVLLAEELSPATVVALGPDVEVRHCDGTDRTALLAALAEADAVLVRSATRMDREAIAAAPRLRVIARAGVGLDNVDVPAATEAGVLVVNAPTSNIVSAAELAIGLLLSVARHIPQADASLKGGSWQRSRFTGVELSGKVLGVVGLGRIGALVARRMAAFDMEVIAYDPYVTPARAADLGVRKVSLDELLAESDFITVHLPKTAETVGLIGFEALRKVKPGVRIVNAARGGIVDENELYAALKTGRVAAAGLDVFEVEPCTDSPLFGLDSVVATPHLGAGTAEAQEKAGVSVADSVRRALAGEHVPDAVNVQGGAVEEDLRPWLPLTERLGRVFAAAAGDTPAQLTLEVAGQPAGHSTAPLELAALKGVLEIVTGSAVSYVNAPLRARERGLDLRLVTSPASPDHHGTVTLEGIFADGRVVSFTATLSGLRRQEKLVAALGHTLDLPLTGDLAFLRYPDCPGAVGSLGERFAEAGVNIAAMQVARHETGGSALAALALDSSVQPDTLADAALLIDATHSWAVRAESGVQAAA
ncbi:3-phosphoglycerate dehydrogenase [Kitasatospora sp. MMS16-BH015]|uniref:phosphoglycerate dehydrogenase n=1 Tax=Kitasatospora sp. MMS16-BH015 TaxID=2018025 RepID=UPI000CA13F4D|nr:phosphoglycerate dehydrogenase [Kitasatospora sp. MMS16-BH015]AUG78192.1 3-phosphoglycerate dehydrogenase [Kitasatospora sp. MMS16-BH015]